MKHLILGTAGHIDHGKTSLVKALTGIDTDRLPEEKARGITIELGFANLDLPGDIHFGIVDVPGHERFIRAMVAGVGGMDLVMLVIAADEGVMPQTREHLEICQLLGVKKGLVALTKSDMVDPDWLAMVGEEVRDYLEGSFLEGAPVMPVCSRSGEGIAELRTELGRLAAEIEQKRNDGPFRLPVDRVFTAAGFGTVVTGTLLSGQIAVGDDVEVLPSGLVSRVRGIQGHGKKMEKGGAGQRLAVNLQGVEHSQVHRGDTVVPRGLYQTTQTVDVRLRLLESSARSLKHRAGLRLHSATYEVPVKVILFDRNALEPGESVFAQLRLARPALLLPGDPFVLRTSSPSATVGGGTVLDPLPPRRRRRSSEALQLLEALESGEDGDIVAGLVKTGFLSGLSFADLASRTGLSSRRLEAALGPLLTSGDLVQVYRDPRLYLSREAFKSLKESLLTELRDFLIHNPLKAGIGREELKTRLPARSDQRFFAPCLASLEKENRIIADRELVKLPGRETAAAEARGNVLPGIEKLLSDGGMEPPTLKEISDKLSLPEKQILEHLNLLIREGKAVKVKSDLFYAASAIGSIRETLVAFLAEKGEVTPTGFRELTGLSRKFMIPILEYFDAEKLTIRVGDKRILRGGTRKMPTN